MTRTGRRHCEPRPDGPDAAAGSASAADRSISPLAAKPPHFAPKAKAVISIFCYGGVSQVDTFDPKPQLMKRQGEAMTGVGEVVVSQGHPGGLMPSPWTFKKYGQCGMDVSELFPNVAEHVDDLALIRSMYCLSNDHGPALFQMNTGTVLAGHPSVGSWVTYGLGTENENLPGYIVFTDYRGGPINGAPNWGNGYMPAAYQGTPFRSTGDPIVDLNPPPGRHAREQQRKWLEFLGRLNREAPGEESGGLPNSRRESTPTNWRSACRRTRPKPSTSTRSQRRRASCTASTRQPTEYFGRQALMARRLVERGVRFVQLYSGGGNFDPSWDAHWDLKGNHGQHCGETDKPIAGLIKDLKSRGPVRFHADHLARRVRPYADFADAWTAAITIPTGSASGWRAAASKAARSSAQPISTAIAPWRTSKSVYDLHATMLHLLGLNHEKLTYRYNGRDMRLTDVHGNLIKEVIA